ncbi:pirin family protein [Pseudoalteromonas sp. T1lg75]|uniref:pirin family protein n=1 Tax=Pseudoalteromonas sp. T1lg75 TaxID=2077102 RepID=UPI000CF69CBF|nr:pirin family protein [Pseudoalteromonas sp. T1lg75]
MSRVSNAEAQQSKPIAARSPIRALLTPRYKDMGGFSVLRSLPTTEVTTIGPWIYFDHLGPATFAPGAGVNVRPHPHIGIATVTYMFDGELLHRDSLGSVQPIRPGDINLMVAGKGVVHSERQSEQERADTHSVEGLQLWLVLPQECEHMDPAFYHYPASSLPITRVQGVPVRVMMGSAYGQGSPVKTFSDTLYLEAELAPGQTLQLPSCEELGLYVVRGHIHCGGTSVPAQSMAVFDCAQALSVSAHEYSRVVLIGGAHLGPRIIDWNFVSSSQAHIEQAREKWRSGLFPKVPGDEEEFIPLP